MIKPLNTQKIKSNIIDVLSEAELTNKIQVQELLKTKFNVDICPCCIDGFLKELNIELR